MRDYLAMMALNNLGANARLLEACLPLSSQAFRARRPGFFPSLSLTLNHILLVDWFYMDALQGGGQGLSIFADEEPFQTCTSLRIRQADADRRLVAYCQELEDGDLARRVHFERDAGPQDERVDMVLLHLFQHQVHHRGQAHAMLSDAGVKPPQLDEFFIRCDRQPSAQALIERTCPTFV